MHINNLPIPLLPAHMRSNDHKLVLRDIISYTSLVFRGRVTAIRREVEFQRGRELDEGEEEEKDCHHRGERPPASR